MSKLIPITDASRFCPDRRGLPGRTKRPGFRTADYRRMLTEMRLRPLSQRTFLKKLLKRAALTGAAHEFPVALHAVRDPVDHT